MVSCKKTCISGDTVVVGSPMIQHNLSKGSVYVFSKEDGYWSEQSVLVPLDGMRAENFGSDVAIYKDTIVVFSYWKDYLGEYSSVLFVYKRSRGTDGKKWTIETILVPPLRHQLTRMFPVFQRMMKSGRFGSSISVSGLHETADTIVIGEPDEHDNSGVAFVYKKTGHQWKLETTFKPKSAEEHYKFGSSVSVVGDLMAISELGSDDVQSRSQASIYLFKRSGSSEGWRLVRRLFASDGKKRDRVGAFVAMDEGYLATSSFTHWSGNQENGPVYLFDIQDLWRKREEEKEDIDSFEEVAP